jgi:hypothetical protein
MDMINLLWDATQQMQIQEALGAAKDAKLEAQITAQQAIDQTYVPYVKQLEKLGLVCQAMWSLIQERTDLTDADLLNRITELDLKDGVLDGKYTKPPVDCPKCGSKMSRKFNRCLFCGQACTDGSAFDTVSPS